jgi:NitT/TauT family transport system ATP-binding protein
LVIAGAGSGKTNTLAHRVAHLVVNGADPGRILLLTFSRRAAAEMERRAERINAAVLGPTGARTRIGWSGTFHAIGARLLRTHAHAIGLDPSFAEREFVAILGPSGCGKSTLLNMVAGFDRPTRGAVRVDGEEIVDPSPRRGVVFQEPAPFPWLSVMENVVFGPKTQRQPVADYRRRAAQILEQMGLRGFEASYPAELSGGMRQRVGIARVLIMQPQVLLMDEPFGSLDAQTRVLMQELLLQVWERHHQTVLFITHDIEEALLLADRVCVMTARPGRIKKSIDVEIPRPRAFEVTTSPEFNALRREVLALIRAESEHAAMESAGAWTGKSPAN